jgi:hypothetical protein
MLTTIAIEVRDMLMSGEPYEKVFSELLNTYPSFRLAEAFNQFRSNYIDDMANLIDANFTNVALEEFASGYANNIKVLCELISNLHIDEAPHDNHSEYSDDCDECELEQLEHNKEQIYLHSYFGATR